MATVKISNENNQIVFTDSEGVTYPYSRSSVDGRYNDTEVWFEHLYGEPNSFPFTTGNGYKSQHFLFADVLDSEGASLVTRAAVQTYLSDKMGFNAAGSAALTTALLAQSGYSHTGAFADKPLSNNFVWEAGAGINYTQEDVNADNYKVLSLSRTVHDAVDNPYWSIPAPSGVSGIGLFQGANLPDGVSTLVDYDFDYDVAYPASSGTGFEGSTGRIKLNDLQYGDQLRVRFDFNAIPQIANTTLEPALWYSNRNDNDEITFTFPLTTQPIFYGGGTVGNTYLNRVEISAWITSNEDVNALTLPAIKSDNPVIIQPLGLLITVIR